MFGISARFAGGGNYAAFVLMPGGRQYFGFFEAADRARPQSFAVIRTGNLFERFPISVYVPRGFGFVARALLAAFAYVYGIALFGAGRR